jgi:tetratricopeptide (TPR) repeat protein
MYSLAMRYFNDAVHAYQLNPMPKEISVLEEIANSLDNLARVKALVGKEFEAITLARRSRDTRDRLGLTYRVALSNVSVGQIHIRFDRYESAEKSLEKAYTLFKRIGMNKRGFGLVEIARAVLYRTMAEDADVLEISDREALAYADKAEAAALEAVEIFRDHIKEPIRLVQAYNELASCYRTRVALLTANKDIEQDVIDMAFNQCRVFFRKSLEIAQEHGYKIEELDILQDIAVLYTRRGDYAQAQKYLRRVESGLPKKYRFIAGESFKEIDEQERIDIFYKYMGLVEMLQSAIIFGENNKQPNEDQWVEMFLHYLLAIAYLNLFSDQTHTSRLLYERVHNRFSNCSIEIIERIIDKDVPRWKKEYDIPPELIDDTVDAVFGSLF